MSLSQYKPELVWKQFEKILTIPRESGKEEKITAYVIEEAQRLGLDHRTDSRGNIIIAKPATPGCETSPAVVLQGHLDMVCEKNSDVEHNFDADPIRTEIKDGYLNAVGTTLGADNGIGVAAALAALEDSSLVHGPIEALFTVDEEAGMSGARALTADFVKGRTLINLDSEEIEFLYVGCAGGIDSNVTFTLQREKTDAAAAGLKLSVRGLRGGHSGCDIENFRANALKLLARSLWNLNEQFSIKIAAIFGGNRRNAIAREASAVISVDKGDIEKVKKAVAMHEQWFKDEYGTVETNLSCKAAAVNLPGEVFTSDISNRLLDFMMAAPHGVAAMSPDIEGLVETSTNMASIKTDGKSVNVQFMTRSSIDSGRDMVSAAIASLARMSQAACVHSGQYSGWKPNMDSRILKTAARAHEQALGIVPEIKAIHAGLECGIIGQQIPGMDMVSFGPQVENPHCPDERLHIDSVETFWKHMAKTLELLARENKEESETEMTV